MEGTTFVESNHARARLAQRGFRTGDVEWIIGIGTRTIDGFLVTEEDIREAEMEVRHKLQVLMRLRGKRVVLSDNSLVTAYHADKSTERNLLRATREQGHE